MTLRIFKRKVPQTRSFPISFQHESHTLNWARAWSEMWGWTCPPFTDESEARLSHSVPTTSQMNLPRFTLVHQQELPVEMNELVWLDDTVSNSHQEKNNPEENYFSTVEQGRENRTCFSCLWFITCPLSTYNNESLIFPPRSFWVGLCTYVHARTGAFLPVGIPLCCASTPCSFQH